MIDICIARFFRPWTLALIAGGIAAAATVARGEITVESLTGNAMTGVGPYYQDIADAIHKFAEKDYTAALARLERAKKNVPRLAPAEVMMAQMYFDSMQPGPAIALLEKLIQRLPQDPEALVMLAERALAEGRVTEADYMFERASKAVEPFNENPKRKQNLQLRTYTGWATVDESRSNWKDARAKLEKLIKLEPQSAVAHERLGRVLFNLEDQKGAYAEFKLASDGDSNLPKAEISMAAQFKDPVNAEKWVKAALAKSANDANTQLGAARFYLRTNQMNEAKTHAVEAVKLDPNGMESNLTVGIVERLLGEFKSAEGHLSTAHLQAPANSVITNNLALVLLELPDEASHQRAMQFADSNARTNPNSVEAVATLGWVSYKLNHRFESDRAFAAVLNSARNGSLKFVTSDIGYYLANYSKDKGQLGEAVRMLTEALSSNEPFAYRKPAQAMLAQLSRAEKSAAGAKGAAADAAKKAGESSKTGASK